MAEQLDNSINSLVAEQVNVQIHRLHQDTQDNLEEICPTLNHRLPFLILALKNLEERKAEFKNDSHEVWTQLIRLMQDIRKWDNKPTPIDLSVAPKCVELITELVSFRKSQPILGETARPEQESRDLMEIALDCARNVLTFLIGEILSLREIHSIAPKAESLFLDLTPKEEITSINADGENYLVKHEVKELSNFILETSVNFYTNLLTNIQNLNKLLILIHKLGQLQPCNPYPLNPIKPELISSVKKFEQFPEVNCCTAKMANHEIQIQYKQTIWQSRRIILLTVPFTHNIIQEELAQQVTKKYYNNPANASTGEKWSRRNRRPTINEMVQEDFQISNILNQRYFPQPQQVQQCHQMKRKCYQCGIEGQVWNQYPVLQQQFNEIGRKCYFCGEQGHTQTTCFMKRRTEFAQSPICCLCKRMGHKSFECPLQQNWRKKQQMAILESAAPLVCYNCREIGHKSFECPLKRTGQNHPNMPGPPLQKQGNQ